jgi:CMP-N,N'-diacetyllegionaminic acid synthase
MAPRLVALIPARSGSTRVPHKNVRPLSGHPLIAYSIAAAAESGVFDAIVVSTDSPAYARVAEHYGAEVPFLRDPSIAGPHSPDIEWVEEVLARLAAAGRRYDCFSILRPTSPFRRADTIRRAWQAFQGEGAAVDSLRAVERCTVHPAKMWVVNGRRMVPLLPLGPATQPWHSSQYPTLPPVYQQNASLEIAWTRVVTDGRTIAGDVLMPFFTEGDEGLDVNQPLDWRVAEELVRSGEAHLPPVPQPPFDVDALEL